MTAVRFYPGTRRIIRPGVKTLPMDPQLLPDWDDSPLLVPVAGAAREFFTIGALAEALYRAPKTIREWERKNQFPAPTFAININDPRAKKRLYSRVQIEGVVLIAEEEKILDREQRYLLNTDFTRRCFELFAATKELPPPYAPRR